jgi:hypothetical protein
MTKGQEIGNVYAIGHRWDECAAAIDAAKPVADSGMWNISV